MLESEIDEWCAEHFNSSFSGRACNLILEWLDRQAAITERNCRVEYEDMRDYLQAQVDGLHEEIGKLKKDRDSSIIKSTVAFSAINGEGGWRDIVSGLEAKVDALESENDRLKEKVSNQRKELDIHQTMYDVEAVAQLKRERKKYKGMYNAEHQTACSQRRKLDRLTEENEAMRQALKDLGDILG
jgi:cell division protein FtsB